jgi:hypothetical protein
MALSSQQFAAHIPVDPGSAVVPEGHVRLWHYTGTENLPSIQEHGLSTRFAKGETYGEPNMVWASAGTPKHGDFYSHNYVEFHAHPSELDIGRDRTPESLQSYGSHVTMARDVPPERILGIHEPWHANARYLRDDPRTYHDYTEGDFKDVDTGDPGTDKALRIARGH